ncbi:MAG: flagellar motor protein MotB [Opitutus sp.]|nr:flagellar motor protein MotB [Opitutus sp.]
MNTRILVSTALLSVTLLSGCASRPTEARGTNPQQPGPAVGYAVGSVVGAVTGQVTGAVAAGAEATADAMKAPFNNERRVVRRWRAETTADGRTIQVPYEVEVDAQGRVIEPPKN